MATPRRPSHSSKNEETGNAYSHSERFEVGTTTQSPEGALKPEHANLCVKPIYVMEAHTASLHNLITRHFATAGLNESQASNSAPVENLYVRVYAMVLAVSNGYQSWLSSLRR